MYLKPPLQIEKYLAAAILQNDNVNIIDIPLCLATNLNEPTPNNLAFIESQYVERDWIPRDSVFISVMRNKGEVMIEVNTL